MTTNRPYRRALSSAAAIAELRSCSGTQFDPRVVELVIELLDEGQESSVLESVDSVSALTEPDRLAAAG
jgi:HD-GYP domain-containing protein (c-di-GMP phosphodiesterase class II)